MDARHYANLIADEVMHIHRGVTYAFEIEDDADDSLIVAFGNDCYDKDPRSKQVAKSFGGYIEQFADIVDFATDDSGGTWAMLLRVDDDFDIDAANRCLWDMWFAVSTFETASE